MFFLDQSVLFSLMFVLYRFDFVLIFFSPKLLLVGLLMSTCSSDFFLFVIVMR